MNSWNIWVWNIEKFLTNKTEVIHQGAYQLIYLIYRPPTHNIHIFIISISDFIRSLVMYIDM